MITTPGTGLLCLLGHPVAHSVSPQIHSAALEATGFDAVYLAFEVAPAALETAVAGLRTVGFVGANVTVPHKQAVLALVDRRTPECDAVGAANTLYWEDGALVADNTDAAALVDVLRDDVGVGAGSVALVFGAGGAARAAAVALGRCGAAVRVRARREDAAGAVGELALSNGAADAGDRRPDLVINATPLGLRGEALPEDLMALEADQIALDLVYAAQPTPFLAAAQRVGARDVDGLAMLVAQAARSFERWTARSAPRAVMDAAAHAALGRKLPAP